MRANLVRLLPFISHSWFLAQCSACSRCSINNDQMNVRPLELLLVGSFKGSHLDSHSISGTGHLEYCPNYPFIFLYPATPLFSLPGSGPPLRELFGLAHPREETEPQGRLHCGRAQKVPAAPWAVSSPYCICGRSVCAGTSFRMMEIDARELPLWYCHGPQSGGQKRT